MSGKPIYQQIADELLNLIGSGELGPGDRVPSTNELSKFHSVNPTTSAKALTELFDAGLVEKRRGLGMFVLPEARDKVLHARRAAFAQRFIHPLLTEADHLGLSAAELQQLIDHERSAR
ncbi:GntR family transcriptional regulator [Corynebacterium breve]|uniref:GntR family transcriptional regulator n=1 Tax=Corynebacterium breve TaxID=3049799 RepID=A0ABY8VFU1_9CORY|nr:GntR family transcriptional regulator [Corynebacterium breve]WIM68202.1 GntR family transcriptional regulator [Corynebacterium breve]